MTIKDKMLEIRGKAASCDLEGYEKLMWLAYWMGREEGTKLTADAYNERISEAEARALNCRYYRMASEVLGHLRPYSPDYSGDVTRELCSDPFVEPNEHSSNCERKAEETVKTL